MVAEHTTNGSQSSAYRTMSLNSNSIELGRSQHQMSNQKNLGEAGAVAAVISS